MVYKRIKINNFMILMLLFFLFFCKVDDSFAKEVEVKTEVKLRLGLKQISETLDLEN